MTAEILSKFDFHEVGQGLFYSGKIDMVGNGRRRTFNFIYDCGSLRKRNIDNCLNEYFDGISGEIDMLVISHFDKDHISGIDLLLEKMKIDTVILPYLLPIERLSLALKGENAPSSYYDFLSNPILYLFERHVRRIIIVGGGGGEEGVSLPGNFPDNPQFLFEENEGNIDLQYTERNEELENEILHNEHEWNSYIGNGRLKIISHAGPILGFHIWLFAFYNVKAKQELLDLFLDHIKNILNTNSLQEVIVNEDKRDELREVYKSFFNGNINQTSLLMYHSPVIRLKIQNIQFFISASGISRNQHYRLMVQKDGINCYVIPDHINEFQSHIGIIGQLLTGDIDLNIEFNNFSRHFDLYKDNIGISLLPHHGSHQNWNENVLKDFENCRFFIASSASISRYSHPSMKIVMQLLQNKRDFLWCNEDHGVSINYAFKM